MTSAPDAVIRQLSSVVDAYQLALSGVDNDLSNLDATDGRLLLTRALAAIERTAPPTSAYTTQAHNVAVSTLWNGAKARELVAIVRALRDDYAEGAMQSVEELVHADLFGDFIDMAMELHDKRFIGPAAVVAGSVLEEHLRKLAAKHQLDVSDDRGRPKSVDALSIELRNARAFSELQRKSVTTWYAQRNEAAHGRFDGLVAAEVERMIDGVRDFVGRYPA